MSGGIQRFQPKKNCSFKSREAKTAPPRLTRKKFSKIPRKARLSPPSLYRSLPRSSVLERDREVSSGNETAFFAPASAKVAAQKKKGNANSDHCRTDAQNTWSPTRPHGVVSLGGHRNRSTTTLGSTQQRPVGTNPAKRYRLPPSSPQRHNNVASSVVPKVDSSFAGTCSKWKIAKNANISNKGRIMPIGALSTSFVNNSNEKHKVGLGGNAMPRVQVQSTEECLAKFKHSKAWKDRKMRCKHEPQEVVVDLTCLSDDEVQVVPASSIVKETPKIEYPLTWAERQALVEEKELLRLRNEEDSLSCQDKLTHVDGSAGKKETDVFKMNRRDDAEIMVTEFTAEEESTCGDGSIESSRSVREIEERPDANAAPSAIASIPIKSFPVDMEAVANISHVLLGHVKRTEGLGTEDETVAFNEDFDPSKSRDTQTDGVLTCVEIELAWLMEESRFCSDRDEGDWSFVWTYASPALRVLLRKGKNAVFKKGQCMVRKEVREAFRQKAEEIKLSMKRGYRRPEMAKVIAGLRVFIRTQSSMAAALALKKPSHVTKKWESEALHHSRGAPPTAPKAGPKSPRKSSKRAKLSAPTSKHLNKQEEEIAWLLEESVLQNVSEGIDYDFVQKHASPELQTLIERHSGSYRWLPRLIRQSNTAVMREFELKREEIRDKLYSGFRRDETKAALPAGYMSTSEYRQQQKELQM